MAIRNVPAAARPPRRPPVATAPTRAAPRPDDAGTAPNFTESERRHQRISDAAYFRAAARGFAAGREMEDWLDAEREIDERLFSGEIGLS